MSWQAVFITKVCGVFLFCFFRFYFVLENPTVTRYVEVRAVPAGARPDSRVPRVADGPRSTCEVRETRRLDNFVR